MKALAKKSTAYQLYATSCWWLIVTVPNYLQFARHSCIFRLKIAISPTVFWLYTPGGGMLSNVNVIYTSLKSTFVENNTGLSSFIQPLLPPKCAKSLEIPSKFELVSVQGHPRSSTLVSIESLCATSCSYSS